MGEETKVSFLFLDSVYVRDTLKKLKNPIPLKQVTDENGSLILSNNEFSLLVVCENPEDGLQEAKWEFHTLFNIFTDPAIPDGTPAKEFGRKLQSAVRM